MLISLKGELNLDSAQDALVTIGYMLQEKKVRDLRDALQEKDPQLDLLIMKEEAGALSKHGADILQGERNERENKNSKIKANSELLSKKGELFAKCKISSGYRTKEGFALDGAIAEPSKERTGENDVMIPRCEPI